MAAASPSTNTTTTPASPAASTPATDSQGFVDSTARCSAPDIAVAFGSTDSSRVAICKTPAGVYQYRAVRVRDGAKLTATATTNASGSFTANSDGITYTVSSKSLDISDGSQVIRSEPMTYFKSGGAVAQAPAGAPSAPAPAGTPVTPVTGAPMPPPTTPLPPPLPAEVGSAPGHSAH
ncbi:hypothetical protein [Mycobacterium sp. OTB74]|uniref:hypothetical protein n=1 Tax=Mycobacterium sp. OTB74 TaxID=1853452 RepID=UPI0024753FBD|nr:hypothetical protein [Mycobacterium sp. OTB74]